MKHIVWDFNGTLLSDAQLGVDCDNHVFDVLGLPRITIEDYRAHMTMPVRDFYTALGVDLNVYKYETISRLWLDMFNVHAVSVGLVPGALESIARLKELGMWELFEKMELPLCQVLAEMERGTWKKILFAPTGALLSPTTTFQGESIPAISHAVQIEI